MLEKQRFHQSCYAPEMKNLLEEVEAALEVLGAEVPMRLKALEVPREATKEPEVPMRLRVPREATKEPEVPVRLRVPREATMEPEVPMRLREPREATKEPEEQEELGAQVKKAAQVMELDLAPAAAPSENQPGSHPTAKDGESHVLQKIRIESVQPK
jgi:hypothetical protein